MTLIFDPDDLLQVIKQLEWTTDRDLSIGIDEMSDDLSPWPEL